MRKAAYESMNKVEICRYESTQFEEALALADGLLTTPQLWEKNIRRTTASLTMRICYGLPMLQSAEDPQVTQINDFAQKLTRVLVPGTHLVEFLPWLRYVPSRFAKWKRDAEQLRMEGITEFERLFSDVKRALESGIDRPSLAETFIKSADRYGLTSEENSWLAAVLYIAGAETISSTLIWWMLAMVSHPEVQARAQTELDTVIGRERAPTLQDLPNLPYICAMVKETLRWRTAAPLSVPHRSSEDDWYEGYLIPKGTIIIANVWAYHQDSETFGDDFDRFNPARYLDANGEIISGFSESREEGHFTYGFGRRVCVGKYLANQSLFIDMALMLWACKIEKDRDPVTGEEVPVDIHGFFDSGVEVRPAPFRCSITPRFAGARSLIEEERKLSAERSK